MSRICGYSTEEPLVYVDKCVCNKEEALVYADKCVCRTHDTVRRKKCANTPARYIYIMPAVLCIIFLSIMTMTGCSKNESKEHTVIDYTVVENEDLPAELRKLIDNKKENTLRLTYTTKDYTYVVAGFGTKETSGYSIKVNDVYKSGDAIYADFALIGPSENEAVNEVATTPYIVLKYEKRDEPVVFKM